jgi:hypothetical protein
MLSETSVLLVRQEVKVRTMKYRCLEGFGMSVYKVQIQTRLFGTRARIDSLQAEKRNVRTKIGQSEVAESKYLPSLPTY